jgi:hypothetical protein
MHLATLVWQVLLWIWFHRTKIFEGILQIGAVAGIVYLVLDTYFQTEATISSTASDPKDPFYFPFSVANNSHIFSIRDVKWRCVFVYMMNDSHVAFMNDGTDGSGFQEEILPNGILNIDCNGLNPVLRIAPPIMAAKISIDLSYNTSVLRTKLFSWQFHRAPPPTEFNWYGGASNPQWIKGKSLRPKPKDLPPNLRYDPKTEQFIVVPY